MQEPIISPWLIYLANSTGAVRFALCTTVLANVVILCVAAFIYHEVMREVKSMRDRSIRYDGSVSEPASKEADKLETEANKVKKKAIIASVVIIVGVIVAALIPSKDACYQMIAAHYLTYENVDSVGGQAKEVVDYIFDKVDEVTEDE